MRIGCGSQGARYHKTSRERTYSILNGRHVPHVVIHGHSKVRVARHIAGKDVMAGLQNDILGHRRQMRQRTCINSDVECVLIKLTTGNGCCRDEISRKNIRPHHEQLVTESSFLNVERMQAWLARYRTDFYVEGNASKR